VLTEIVEFLKSARLETRVISECRHYREGGNSGGISEYSMVYETPAYAGMTESNVSGWALIPDGQIDSQ